jgi:hypothetical protein
VSTKLRDWACGRCEACNRAAFTTTRDLSALGGIYVLRVWRGWLVVDRERFWTCTWLLRDFIRSLKLHQLANLLENDDYRTLECLLSNIPIKEECPVDAVGNKWYSCIRMLAASRTDARCLKEVTVAWWGGSKKRMIKNVGDPDMKMK